MLLDQSPYQLLQRYRTLKTHRITALPIVILMPHSACNCRCVMCDIWKGNKNVQQLTEKDLVSLLAGLKKFGTKRVLMSGGEALLNPLFFLFCELLNKRGIKVTLLSTGIALKRNAEKIIESVDEVIVSLDGDEELHNEIRNIPAAFSKMKEGIETLKNLDPGFRISGRSVIHKINFRKWPSIVDAAKILQLDSISFLPADTTSTAFNREERWTGSRQQEITPAFDELLALLETIEQLITTYHADFESGYILESPEKLRKIYAYYSAAHGLNPYPYKKCNAPWVSAVVEADGSVRPCFFHGITGNIRTNTLEEVLNSPASLSFRKSLNMETDPTCSKCVCYLNLSPQTVP